MAVSREADAVYLDYNASTPLRPVAAEAVAAALEHHGNPSSVHTTGRAARRIVEDARDRVAALAAANAADVVFTSGATEANNLALRGVGRARVLVSAIEHDSVLRAAPNIETVPVDANGVVCLDSLEAALARDPRPALVSVMLANNETGVIQPVAAAAAIAHSHGALLHCDAVQAAGRIVMDTSALGADLFSLSAHKMGGPKGVGALVVADHVALAPEIRGGGQERGRRGGTENVPGIAGFGAAAAEVAGDPARQDRVAALRDGLERDMLAHAPEAVIFGRAATRLPNTICVALPGIASEIQVVALDLAGVAVSAGAACSSGKVAPSRVLAAMLQADTGAAPALATSAIRVSLGWASTEADAARFLEAWCAMRDRVLGQDSAA